MTTRSIFAADALLPSGWASNVALSWNEAGTLTRAEAGCRREDHVPLAQGPVIPGMPNLHSHAFQRAFAGLTEHRSAEQDSFWSWRTLMYRFAAKLDPQQMKAIATWLYIEMLAAGYTSVCEFQYLHHDADGRPYADDATMSMALLEAARDAGIGMTLLPVLYQTSGFGAKPPSEGQRRFIRSNESMLRLLERLRPMCDARGVMLGVAPHSLRAVPEQSLSEIVTGVHAADARAPIHIHIAEQRQEVEDSVAFSGQRPVAWLLDHAAVDQRWCLVHATHMDANEVDRAARSGAVAGLCPSTEANLGDGLFAFEPWSRGGGRWGIGSDSHATVDAAEDLMLLEYGQRLLTGRRSVGATAAQPHVATALTLSAVEGGSQASGRHIAGLAAGQQADFVVLDPQHPALAGLAAQDMLSAHVFASHRTSAIAETWVGGRPLVGAGGTHRLGEAARSGFIAARQALLQGS